MKRILIPTDYSATSENATRYALSLNKVLKYEVVLFHSYYIPVPTSEAAVVIPDHMVRTDATKAMKESHTKFKNEFPGTVISSHVSEGFPDIEILAAEKKLKPGLVVMGSSGMNALKRFLLGSNSIAVIEKSDCPVIVVPEQAKFMHLNKIVFAANYGEDDFKNIFDLINFVKPFKPEIVLLHVSTGRHDKTFDYNQLDGFKNQIQSESQYENLSIRLLEDENVFEGIDNYIDEVRADLFVISMRNRSFLQNVFRPGLTRKMIYHTKVPVMVFHTDV